MSIPLGDILVTFTGLSGDIAIPRDGVLRRPSVRCALFFPVRRRRRRFWGQIRFDGNRLSPAEQEGEDGEAAAAARGGKFRE